MEDDAAERSPETRPGLTRRNLFELTGLAAAAAAFPSPIFSADSRGNAATSSSPSADSVMARLSAYMGEASARSLPQDVVEKTKQHVLDTLAAMISGTALRPGKAALDFARAYGGKEICTVVASDIL